MKVLKIILRIILFPVRIIIIAVSFILALLISPISFICLLIKILGILAIIIAVIYFAVFNNMCMSNQLIMQQLLLMCAFGIFLISAAFFIPWFIGKLSVWMAKLSSALRFENQKEND